MQVRQYLRLLILKQNEMEEKRAIMFEIEKALENQIAKLENKSINR